MAAAAPRAEDILAAVAASASFLQDRKASGSSHWPGPIQRGPGRFFGGIEIDAKSIRACTQRVGSSKPTSTIRLERDHITTSGLASAGSSGTSTQAQSGLSVYLFFILQKRIEKVFR